MAPSHRLKSQDAENTRSAALVMARERGLVGSSNNVVKFVATLSPTNTETAPVSPMSPAREEPSKRALSDAAEERTRFITSPTKPATSKRLFLDPESSPVERSCVSPSTEANSDASDCEGRDDRCFSEACASACDGLDNWVHSVRFAREPVILGRAVTDYDRTPIRVDLSKTPYALFHKDAVLLKNPKDASPSHGGRGRTISNVELWGEDVEADGRGGGTSSDDEEIELQRRRRPNFSGVWRRDRAEGFEELLRFSGVNVRAAAAAAARSALHVIDHDDDYLRLIVKNGLVKVDSHYIIGDDEERTERAGNGAAYSVKLFWGDGTGDGVENQLVLSSVDAAAGKEMIAIRTISDDGNTLVLQQIVRLTESQAEARAKHYFTRVRDRVGLRAQPAETPAAQGQAVLRAAP